jgi:hypothetical protein
MSLLRGFLALGVLFALTAPAAMGEDAKDKDKHKDMRQDKRQDRRQDRREDRRADRARRVGARAGGSVGKFRSSLRPRFANGIVIAVRHNFQQPGTGSFTIRLGDGHRYRLSAGRRRALGYRHHSFTVTFETQFERILSGAAGTGQQWVSFRDLRQGDRVRVLRHELRKNVARLVDILHHYARRHRRGWGGGSSGGGTTVVRRRPHRHPLVLGSATARYLARNADRLEDWLLRHRHAGLRGWDRREDRWERRHQLARAVTRHALVDGRAATRFVRNRVASRVDRTVDRRMPHGAEKKPAGTPVVHAPAHKPAAPVRVSVSGSVNIKRPAPARHAAAPRPAAPVHHAAMPAHRAPAPAHHAPAPANRGRRR